VASKNHLTHHKSGKQRKVNFFKNFSLLQYQGHFQYVFTKPIELIDEPRPTL
jgi:hypothetical protein